MNLLLDSHAFTWFVTGDRRLSSPARQAVEASDAIVYVSAATAWEVATKVRLGKWPDAQKIVDQLTEVMTAFRFVPLPISVEHGHVAGLLPGPHRDHFDRMLAAQSLVETLPLVTADPAFHTFGTRILW